jgi:hypothetical protein
MVKFHWVWTTVLVTAMISSLPISSTRSARAQTNLTQEQNDNQSPLAQGVGGSRNTDNSPPVDPKTPVPGRIGGSSNTDNPSPVNPGAPVPGRTGTSRSANPWGAVLRALTQAQDNKPPKDRRPPVPPGTAAPRGGICAIAPKSIGTTTQIWNTRPLFAWTGPFKRLELRRVGSSQLLWSHKIAAKQNRVLYGGDELQPGETYEWKLFFSDHENAPVAATEQFRVIDGQERDRITEELQSLNEQLKNLSPEDKAKQRAQYFVQQQLWSDVLQEAYSVENPSPALTNMVKALPKAICPNSSQANSTQPR